MLVDPDAFMWTDQAWRGVPRHALVVYELHVGTFTEAGTFAAAGERLEDLVDLGVTAIELMPVAAFPGARNWGYDGAALFAPAASYGHPDEMRALDAGIPIAYLMGSRSWNPVVRWREFWPVPALRQYGCQAWHPSRELPGVAHSIRSVRAAGYAVNVWTVNTEAELRYFAQLPVDGLITDRPDVARTIITATTTAR